LSCLPLWNAQLDFKANPVLVKKEKAFKGNSEGFFTESRFVSVKSLAD